MPEELSRNQPILRFDVILQHDWPIEQCLLHIRVFFGGKTKRPCFDLFIHWLIKQITNTYRNQFSRSYENRSNRCLSLLGLKGRLNSQTSRLQNGSNQIQISLKKEFTTLCALSSINESGIKRVRQNFTPLFE